MYRETRRVNLHMITIQNPNIILQMFDGHRVQTSHYYRILQHALYDPGLLGALDKRSEEIIHEGKLYKD